MPEVDVEVGGKRGLKDDDYSNGGATKMLKSDTDTIEVRLLLLGRNCGSIIGRGGENISRLRNQYSVQLRMPSTSTVDRAMTLQGSVESCIAVVREVLSHSAQVPYSTNAQCNVEVNLLVPTTLIGSIVGKGGCRITEIREATQCKVKVYEDCLPASNERVVAIGGESEEQVLVTITTILNILREIPTTSRSKINYYDPANACGIPPPLLSSSSAKKSHNNNNNNSVSNFPVNVGPLMGSSVKCEATTSTGPQPLMNVTPQPLSGGGIVGGGVVGGNHGVSNTLGAWLHLLTTTTITTPHDMCGMIIGKGGCRISEIRNGSGATITFSEQESKESKDDRVITITGTQQQVQRAEQMITRFMSTQIY